MAGKSVPQIKMSKPWLSLRAVSPFLIVPLAFACAFKDSALCGFAQRSENKGQIVNSIIVIMNALNLCHLRNGILNELHAFAFSFNAMLHANAHREIVMEVVFIDLYFYMNLRTV